VLRLFRQVQGLQSLQALRLGQQILRAHSLQEFQLVRRVPAAQEAQFVPGTHWTLQDLYHLGYLEDH